MTRQPQIFVCTNMRLSGASCGARGAHEVLKALRADPAVKDGTVSVCESVCMGYCQNGPNAKVMGGDFHHGLAPEDTAALIDAAKAARDEGSGG